MLVEHLNDTPTGPLVILLYSANVGANLVGFCVLVQIVAREKRVAFIGISNWALDPAKMNCGVMVTRGDPDRMELELSAK